MSVTATIERHRTDRKTSIKSQASSKSSLNRGSPLPRTTATESDNYLPTAPAYPTAAATGLKNTHSYPPVLSSPNSLAPGHKSVEDVQPAAQFNMTLRHERIYLASLCLNLFMAGWNDATLGPLLPRIQDHYHIDYTVVSVLFIVACLGFIGGAGCNVYLTDRLGFGKVVAAAAAVQIAAYAVMAPAPPFPVLCIAYVLNGFGIALQDAQSNTFIASIPRHSSTNMGVLHAVYGLGAFTSPFIATQFAQKTHWSFHFLVSMSIALINTGVLIYVFRGKRQEYFIPEAVAEGVNGEAPVDNNVNTKTKYKQILGNRIVGLLAAYILVYVGVEVTIGGWIFTYLLKERGGGPSAGYVSSGFFGGLTLGRVLLLPVNKKVGFTRVVYIYTALAIGLELTIWLVPNLVGNAVAVSFVGLLLGPMYPICMNVAAGVLPPRILGGSIGFIAATGQAGSAIFPFMTGALANKYGVRVLEPLLVSMLVVQAGLWFCVTRPRTSRLD